MPNRMKDIGEPGDFLVPPGSDETVAKLGEVAALRQITNQLDRTASAIDKLSDKVSDMHTDVALMKQQSERIAELKDRTSQLRRYL